MPPSSSSSSSLWRALYVCECVCIWARKEIKKIICRRTLIKFSYTFIVCGIKRRFKGHFIYNVRFAGVSIFERLRAIFCKNTLDLWGCNLFMCATIHWLLLPIFTCPIWCYCCCCCCYTVAGASTDIATVL